MNIKREGKVYRLSEMELYDAYIEQQLEFDMDNIAEFAATVLNEEQLLKFRSYPEIIQYAAYEFRNMLTSTNYFEDLMAKAIDKSMAIEQQLEEIITQDNYGLANKNEDAGLKPDNGVKFVQADDGRNYLLFRNHLLFTDRMRVYVGEYAYFEYSGGNGNYWIYARLTFDDGCLCLESQKVFIKVDVSDIILASDNMPGDIHKDPVRRKQLLFGAPVMSDEGNNERECPDSKKNDISQETCNYIKKNLAWMEKYLDEELDQSEIERRNAYMEIRDAICNISPQEAKAKLNAWKKDLLHEMTNNKKY